MAWVQLTDEEMQTIAAIIPLCGDSAIASVIANKMDAKLHPATPEVDADYLAAARERYGRDGELEFDDEAVVSHGSDPGAYVMAWRWISENDL